MKQFLLLTALAALVLLAGGCAGVWNGKEPIKIGAVLPLTGPDAANGERVRDGISFAVQQQKTHFKRNVKVIYADNKSDPALSAELAADLADQGVKGLILGFDSRQVAPVTPVLNEWKLPAVAPMASNDRIGEGCPYFFRNCFKDSQQGAAIAYYAWFWRKLAKITIVTDETPGAYYSQDVARYTAQSFQEFGGIIVSTVKYGEGRDLRQTMRDAMAGLPPGIVLTGDARQCAEMFRILREMGYSGIIFGPDSWDDPVFFKNCGKDIGDSIYTSLYSRQQDTEEYREFAKTFRETLYFEPGDCEAQGYDALRLMLIGLENAGNLQEIRANFAKVHNWYGAGGIYTFDAKGNCDRTIYINAVKLGKGKEIPEGNLLRTFTMSKLELTKDK